MLAEDDSFGDIGLEEQLAIFIRCAAVHLVAILIEKAELCPWELFLGICGNLLKRYLVALGRDINIGPDLVLCV